MTRKTIGVVFGTRPEAIKLAPVIWELRRQPDAYEPIVIVTAQHRGMLDQVLEIFEITPDVDLNVMTPGQTLTGLTSVLAAALGDVFQQRQPDMVLVQGDTTTTFMGALCAFYRQIPVGHVEAGLRTHNKFSPFPEEMNRQLVSSLADLHFPPTTAAAENLRRVRVPEERILVTGNTGIDSLRLVSDKYAFAEANAASGTGRMMLVTTHRRENFGGPLLNILHAIRALVDRYPDLRVVLPVHLNPAVKSTVEEVLSGIDRVSLVPPMSYVDFVRAMHAADIILTDSGGVQEEAPYFGTPVLVMRDTSERMEGVEAGCLQLVGTDRDVIIRTAAAHLDRPPRVRSAAPRATPFGDGFAARRIVEAVGDYLDGSTRVPVSASAQSEVAPRT